MSDAKETVDEDDADPGRKGHSVWPVSFITLFSVLFLCCVGHSFATLQQDNKGCRMSYMMPSYVAMTGFDTEHTRFAAKYSLYLYREQGIDTSTRPTGIPVLFVPGNAGSYKQVRSIAAEAANQFAETLKADAESLQRGQRNLDFFTVDFNEDFSAFHGQTLLDQAEYLNSAVTYILSLYTDARKSPSDQTFPDPTSVLLLGHSMGGIVARTMLTMPNYLPKSINTIITMSTPHAKPPAPFDSKIQGVYTRINHYWRRCHEANKENPLADVALVSIAGGGLDTIVSSDYASLLSIVPPSNGFTVFTTTIPYVWTSVDHQAILWCDQMRKVLARCLLEVVDAQRASQTKVLDKRIRILQRHLLSELEIRQELGLGEKAKEVLHLSVDAKHIRSEFTRIHRFGPDELSVDTFSIPTSSESVLFQVLTDVPTSSCFEASCIIILACKSPHGMSSPGQEETALELSCFDISAEPVVLPGSHDLGSSGHSERLYYQSHSTKSLSGYSHIAIKSKLEKPSSFLLAELLPSSVTNKTYPIGTKEMISSQFSSVLTQNRPFVTTLHIETPVNSLIAYKLSVRGPECPNRQFVSITRQYISEPFETKFFIGNEQMEISIHGSSPYFMLPQELRKGFAIQHWSDPSCPGDLEISLAVDYYGSLGKLVLRYRVATIVFPMAMALLVFAIQMRSFNRDDQFLPFHVALRRLVASHLIPISAVITLATVYLVSSQSRVSNSVETFMRQYLSMIFETGDLHQFNDMLLGLQDISFWWLAPVFLLVSIGILNILSMVVSQVVLLLSFVFVILKCKQSWLDFSPVQSSGKSIVSKRRLITTATLLVFVATVVPYQFAYLVACIAQLLTCIRSSIYEASLGTKVKSGLRIRNFTNYNLSILTLMLCVLPINLPVLAVWIRNVSVQWFTPFSTHHNVLSIAPTILLVESLTSASMLPKMHPLLCNVLSAFLVLLSCLACVYGAMYTYTLHHLLNILSGIIFLLSLMYQGSSVKKN